MGFPRSDRPITLAAGRSASTTIASGLWLSAANAATEAHTPAVAMSPVIRRRWQRELKVVMLLLLPPGCERTPPLRSGSDFINAEHHGSPTAFSLGEGRRAA